MHLIKLEVGDLIELDPVLVVAVRKMMVNIKRMLVFQVWLWNATILRDRITPAFQLALRSAFGFWSFIVDLFQQGRRAPHVIERLLLQVLWCFTNQIGGLNQTMAKKFIVP